MTRRRRTGRPDDAEAVAPLVERAMADLGWLIPRSEEEVAAAEAAPAARTVEIPEALRDPRRVLDRPHSSGRRYVPLPASADVEAALARAAREAGHLTPEIERRMRLDRQAAEREMDDARDADLQPDRP